MSEDIKQRVISELKSEPLGKFAIQIDEWIDVAVCAQLLVFLPYVSGEDFKEFLFCHTLDSTTCKAVFNQVSNFLEREGLSWNNVYIQTIFGRR